VSTLLVSNEVGISLVFNFLVLYFCDLLFALIYMCVCVFFVCCCFFLGQYNAVSVSFGIICFVL